jgi:hypothetical protein
VSVNLPYHPKLAEALELNSSQKTLEREVPANAKKPKKNKRNIADEFDRYFGNASKLENWQRLCKDVGVQGDLPSVKQCRMVSWSDSCFSQSRSIKALTVSFSLFTLDEHQHSRN